MARGRQYAEWERAQAVSLTAELGSISGAASRLKIPTATIRGWVRLEAARAATRGETPTTGTLGTREGSALGPDAIAYLKTAGEEVRRADSVERATEAESGGVTAGTLSGWRGYGVDRARVEGVVHGWVRQQEEAQLTASKLMEIVRWSLSPVKHDDLKALALALKSITELGQAGADKHLDYVHGRGAKGPAVDARSYTLSQAWHSIEEDRGRSRLAGRAGTPAPSPAPLPPGIITTPAPPTYPPPPPDV